MILRAQSHRVIAVACAVLVASTRAPGDVVWSGLGLNSNWTSSANWQGAAAPANDGTEQILFGTATRTSVIVNTPQNIRRLRFDFSSATIRSYSLSGLAGSTLTLGDQGVEIISGAGAGAVTFESSLGLVLGTAQTWNVDSSSSLRAAGTLSGSGPLTLSGGGYVELSGTNTYTGGTVLSGGPFGIENNSALGTGALTVNGDSAIYSYSGARTLANALNLNSNFLDLLPYGGELRFTGPVTLGANTTLRNYGQLVYLTGAIGETGGARSLTVSGFSPIVLSGTNTYTGGSAAVGGILLFSNASAVPATGFLSNSSGSYIGIGFNTGVQNAFVSKFSPVSALGTIGFDTDPTAVSATIFAEPISLAALNASARIGTLTRATFSPAAVITPAVGAGYRFGGGGGSLRVESQLTGANNLTVDSPSGFPLSVMLTNATNDYVGGTSVTGSALVFGPGAVSSGSLPGTFVLNNSGYIGTSDTVLSLATWLGKFSAATLTGVIGFDSVDVSSPRTISGAIDLSPFVSGTSIALGTSSAAVLTGAITLPASQTNYHLTGYRGGWLTVASALSGARGLWVGSGTGDFPEFDRSDFTRMSTVFLNGSNSHSGGTTLFNGRLVVGHASALGTGSVTIDGTGSNFYPKLETSLTSNPTFTNQLVVKHGVELGGVNAFTWSGNIIDGSSTGTIRKHGPAALTLTGNNAGFSGGFSINEGTITFATNTAAGTGALDLGYNNAIAAFTSAAPSINTLSGDSSTSRLTLGTGTTLTINQASSATFRGQIQGTGGVIKTGAGTLRLENVATFTGGTLINAGLVSVGNAGALGPNTVTLNGTTSALQLDSSVNLPNSVVFGPNGGRLSGHGAFSSSIVIGTNTVVAPGGSVGTLSFVGGLTLASGGSYDFEIQNATAGAGVGWDFVQVIAPMTFTSTVNTPFALNLISLNSSGTSGDVTNFNSSNNYSWAIASASSFLGFNPAALTINTTAFTSNLNGGTFSLSSSGTNLVLNFTPVPEPSTWALLLAGLGVAGFRKLRGRR